MSDTIKPEVTNSWKYFTEICMMKEFIISLFVVVFIGNPYLQIAPLILLSTIMVLGLAKYKPLEEHKENYFLIIVEFLYVLILSGFFYLSAFSHKLSQSVRYAYIGYSMIGLLILVIIVHIIFGIMASIESIRETYKLIKLWCNRKK
jgi:hypothetical protein